MVKYNTDLNLRDINDTTPAHLAAMMGHRDVLCELRKYNTNFNTTNKQNLTPFFTALLYGQVECVRYFIDNDPSIKTFPLLFTVETLKKMFKHYSANNMIGIGCFEDSNLIFFTGESINPHKINKTIIEIESIDRKIDAFILYKLTTNINADKFSIHPRDVAYIMGRKDILELLSDTIPSTFYYRHQPAIVGVISLIITNMTIGMALTAAGMFTLTVTPLTLLLGATVGLIAGAILAELIFGSTILDNESNYLAQMYGPSHDDQKNKTPDHEITHSQIPTAIDEQCSESIIQVAQIKKLLTHQINDLRWNLFPLFFNSYKNKREALFNLRSQFEYYATPIQNQTVSDVISAWKTDEVKTTLQTQRNRFFQIISSKNKTNTEQLIDTIEANYGHCKII